MKPTKLDDVPGESKVDKLAYLLAEHKVLYVQEKFNGIGFRAEWAHGCVQYKTTRGNFWPANFFGARMGNAMTSVLFGLPRGSILYGEFIPEDRRVHLATLAGALNCKSLYRDEAIAIRAVIYDADPGCAQSFYGRACALVGVHRLCNPLITCASVHMFDNVPQIVERYNTIVEAGGEGIIIRADPCYFCAGISPMMWKWKRLHDMEGICVAVKEGEGKRKGMLGAMLVRFPGCDEPVWVGGGAGLTDDVLRLLWTNPPIDQQMTVTYEETSINGTPLRPQLVCPRNYE